MEKCLNCQSDLQGNFCAACGQERIQNSITIRSLFENIARILLFAESPLLRTVKQLIMRPGHFVNEYLLGKRKPFMGPVHFFFLLITLYMLFFNWLGDELIAFLQSTFTNEAPPKTLGSLGSSAIDIQNFVKKNINYFYFLLPPILAGCLSIFFRKNTHRYAENLVFAFYLTGIGFVFSLILILAAQMDARIFSLRLLILIGFIPFAIQQFMSGNKIVNFLKSLAAVLVSYGIYISAVSLVALLFLSVAGPPEKEVAKPMKMTAQNPSPMQENIRDHQRIEAQDWPGANFQIPGIFQKPIDVFLPEKTANSDSANVLIHFHGAAFVPKYAVHASNAPYILIVINLGSGSSVYEKAMENAGAISHLLEKITSILKTKGVPEKEISKLYLSGFSAGYGAIRAALREPANVKEIDGVLLLDGLHTDYIPPGTTLFRGGSLNDEKLQPFLSFAKLAAGGQKRFVLTHSEIFPGTYASTTETADFILEKSGLSGNAVIKWGPGGMQLTRAVHQNGFHLLSFAGNTAPDHIDHFHGMAGFLRYLETGGNAGY